MLDHAAHVVAWQELAIGYVGGVLEGRSWPSDDDYDGGDFDRFNERLREQWQLVPPGEIPTRAAAIRADLLGLVRRLDPKEIRSDAAWGWLYMVLHGHELDHLGILEPWADALRTRQAENDPFGDDGRVGSGDPEVDRDEFWRVERRVFELFETTIGRVPAASWSSEEITPGWTLQDHVCNLADWFEEGAEAIATFRRTGSWSDGPSEGVDAWNARAIARGRAHDAPTTLARFERGRARLEAAADRLSDAELRDPEGWGWVYECLHGHVRAHLAMVGPWCARFDWPT